MARARSVKRAFLLSGVNIENLESIGFGEASPISDNATRSGRAKNRRVVVTVYDLSADEVSSLSSQLSESSYFYVTDIENINVQKYIDQELGGSELSEVSSVEDEGPVAEILPEVETSEISKRKNQNRYDIGAGVNYTKLQAYDIRGAGFAKEAEWLSELNYTLLASYQQKIFNQFWLGLRGEFHLQKYKSEKEIRFVWDEKNPNLLRVSLVTDFEPSKRLNLGFDIDYIEEAFIYAVPPAVTLRKSSLIGVSTRGLYKFYDSKKFRAAVNAKLSYPFVGSDDVLEPKGRLGFLVGLDGSVKNIFKKHELNIQLYYGLRKFTHIESKQDEETAGINLKLRSDLWL